MEIGYEKIVEFSFNQNQVIKFAEVTGDLNPIHLDDIYAKRSIFKKKIIHGYLSASIFSKIFGTIFPGEGTIYLEQSLRFKKPMYVDNKYYTKLTVLEVDRSKHKACIKTEIFEQNTNDITIEGQAKIINTKEII